MDSMENQGFIIYNNKAVGMFDIFGRKVIYDFGFDKDNIETFPILIDEVQFFDCNLVFICDLTIEECEKYFEDTREYCAN